MKTLLKIIAMVALTFLMFTLTECSEKKDISIQTSDQEISGGSVENAECQIGQIKS